MHRINHCKWLALFVALCIARARWLHIHIWPYVCVHMSLCVLCVSCTLRTERSNLSHTDAIRFWTADSHMHSFFWIVSFSLSVHFIPFFALHQNLYRPDIDGLKRRKKENVKTRKHYTVRQIQIHSELTPMISTITNKQFAGKYSWYFSK